MMKEILTALFLTVLFCSCNNKIQQPCSPGVADPDCVCMHLYEPVCGCDGVTYSNSCFAACSNVQVIHQGPCK